MKELHAPTETVWVGHCQSCFGTYQAEDAELKPLASEVGCVRKFQRCPNCRRDMVFIKEPVGGLDRHSVAWWDNPSPRVEAFSSPTVGDMLAEIGGLTPRTETVAETSGKEHHTPTVDTADAQAALAPENQMIEPANPPKVKRQRSAPKANGAK